MATFFADTYAIVELLKGSPASWIKKMNDCYADSIRTDFKLAAGTRSDTRRISTPTRLFWSS
jgi:predicted nucleic acid-binding protein